MGCRTSDWRLPVFGAVLAAMAGCAASPRPPALSPRTIETTQLRLTDAVRHRDIPVLLYRTQAARHRPLAILSHGYGGGVGAYSFLAAALVRRGFVVASIQHLALPGDPPMANEGNLAERRRPVWQIGADSIGVVLAELRARGIANGSAVVLVGHSNGGDMTMLFADEHPDLVRAAISLDNRRMPLPRTRHPSICTLRSIDQVADPGVLPSAAERRRFGVVVIPTRVKHNDMWDGATDAEKAELVEGLSRCLEGSR